MYMNFFFQFVVAGNQRLQKELIEKLVWNRDGVTALKFAEEFGLNRNNWPEALQSLCLYDA